LELLIKLRISPRSRDDIDVRPAEAGPWVGMFPATSTPIDGLAVLRQADR
jgi:hypothetical protein